MRTTTTNPWIGSIRKSLPGKGPQTPYVQPALEHHMSSRHASVISAGIKCRSIRARAFLTAGLPAAFSRIRPV